MSCDVWMLLCVWQAIAVNVFIASFEATVGTDTYMWLSMCEQWFSHCTFLLHLIFCINTLSRSVSFFSKHKHFPLVKNGRCFFKREISLANKWKSSCDLQAHMLCEGFFCCSLWGEHFGVWSLRLIKRCFTTWKIPYAFMLHVNCICLFQDFTSSHYWVKCLLLWHLWT